MLVASDVRALIDKPRTEVTPSRDFFVVLTQTGRSAVIPSSHCPVRPQTKSLQNKVCTVPVI